MASTAIMVRIDVTSWLTVIDSDALEVASMSLRTLSSSPR